MKLARAGLIVVAATVLPSCASFADHGHYRYDTRDAFRTGYERGFQEGRGHGVRDSRRHASFNYRHDHRYRDADSGYRRWYGSRFEYQRGYRRGYERGYQLAFSEHRHDHSCPHDRAVRRGGRWDRDWEDDDRRWERDRW